MSKLFPLSLFVVVQSSIYGQPDSQNLVTNIMSCGWTPTGNEVCFSVIRTDKGWKQKPQLAIFILNLKSNQIKLIAKNALNPSVSPDGRKIAFTKLMREDFRAIRI